MTTEQNTSFPINDLVLSEAASDTSVAHNSVSSSSTSDSDAMDNGVIDNNAPGSHDDLISSNEDVHHVQALVIGSGPAGYTAALYLARAGYKPTVLAGELTPGGQLVNTTTVENYPGFPEGVLGPELMDRMRDQAEKFGAILEYVDVTSVDFTSALKIVTCSDGQRYAAPIIIITTGSQYRKLDVPGEEEFSGHGVSYCATCDGFFFKNKPIVVIGGGDSALTEAEFLSRFGSSVTLIHRRDQFRASQILVDRAKQNPKITLLTNTIVTAIHCDDDAHADSLSNVSSISTTDANSTTTSAVASTSGVASHVMPSVTLPSANVLSVPSASTPSQDSAAIPSSAFGLTLGGNALSSPSKPQSAAYIDLKNTVTGERSTMPAQGIFVAIGHVPATDFLQGHVDMDDDGYILVDGASTRTSVPGVFAAGDCVDRVYRQAISAAGMGCRAALDAQHYLSEVAQ